MAGLAIGALAGGLLGASGAVSGLTILGGAALGATIGGLFSSQKGSKIKAPQDQQQNAAAQTPALPPATTMPATPMTPAASAQAPGILNPNENISPDIPVSERPQEPGEASAPTADEIARGQLEKKRKGRLSTILTTPQSRLENDGEVQQFERLGG